MSTLQGPVTPGVFDPGTGTWYLRNSNSGGAPDAGRFQYGGPGWRAVTGDWTGSGKPGIGVFDPSTGTWYLRNELNAGTPDAGQFQYGLPGWVPVVGDWNGSGKEGIGVFDPATATFYLRNEASAGLPDAGVFRYGAAGWVPVVGDWNGSGHTGIGVFDPSSATFYLRNETNAGLPDAGVFRYGGAGWVPVAGDWMGSGKAGIGVVDPGTGTWYLRNETSAGAPDAGKFAYGAPGWQPVVGDFKPAPTTILPIKITNLAIQNGGLIANGEVGDPVPFTAPIDLTAVPNTADPPILNLHLGPIHLNLLGLVLDTSPICLDITAQPGPGNLLGNLLSNIANLLNQGQSLSSVLAGLTPEQNTTLTTQLGSMLNSVFNDITSLAGTTPSVTNTTNVLNLSLGPVHLNLLGLNVFLNNCATPPGPVTVSITAVSGPGNLLGNLISGLAHLLDNGAATSAIDNLLTLIARNIANLV